MILYLSHFKQLTTYRIQIWDFHFLGRHRKVNFAILSFSIKKESNNNNLFLMQLFFLYENLEKIMSWRQKCQDSESYCISTYDFKKLARNSLNSTEVTLCEDIFAPRTGWHVKHTDLTTSYLFLNKVDVQLNVFCLRILNGVH